MKSVIVNNTSVSININELPELLQVHVIRSLTVTDDEGNSYYLFDVVDEGSTKILVFSIGYYEYLDIPDEYVQDNRTNNISIDKDEIFNDLDFIRNILNEEIILRDDQVSTVMRMLLFKSGICQLATGSGKSEIVCAFLKYLIYKLKRVPNTIIFVPTIKLVNQMIERLARYGIEAVSYNSTRTVEGIVVTHPASVNNDIKLGVDNVNDLEILVCDEGHHLSANSWRYLLSKATNVEYRIAMSASVVENYKLKYDCDLSDFTDSELLVIGATGKVLVNYPTKYYIDNKILALPVVMRLDNPANDELVGKPNWRVRNKYGFDYQQVVRSRIESDVRYDTAINSLEVFLNYGRKVLILTNTKSQAYALFDKLIDNDLGRITSMVFGGNQKYSYDEYSNTYKLTKDDVMEDYSKGKYQILIGTSVLYEGIDVPNLDVVLLYYVGKKDRALIQSIGRVLRKTKTGRYAYIIDFTDHEDPALRKQSLTRRELYKEVIGVDENLMFDKITKDMVDIYFKSLEGIK